LASHSEISFEERTFENRCELSLLKNVRSKYFLDLAEKKLKAGNFDGPSIPKLNKDQTFPLHMTEVMYALMGRPKEGKGSLAELNFEI